MNMIKNLVEQSSLFEEQAQLLKVLTHPARLAILDLLSDGEHCVCHLEAYLGYRQAYISQQLAVLRAAELIQDRREGWNIYYRVTDRRVYTLLDLVIEMTGQEKQTIRRENVTCLCPHCNKSGLSGR
jgi:DNA-binding transcriptional ArsR family regulator